jgi:hypothetical protein
MLSATAMPSSPASSGMIIATPSAPRPATERMDRRPRRCHTRANSPSRYAVPSTRTPVDVTVTFLSR